MSCSALAQENVVPVCSLCLPPSRPALPEPGHWYNPLQPGSGFTFDVQNHTLAGAFFSYEIDGAPVWYTFAGKLQRGAGDTLWTVSADLHRSFGGNCARCAYRFPSVSTSGERLTIEFMQRGVGRFRLGEEAWQIIQPLNFGYFARQEFAPEFHYAVPDLTGPWSLIFREPFQDMERGSYYGYVSFLQDDLEFGDGSVVYYFSQDHSVETILTGDLVCKGEGNDIQCVLSHYYGRGGVHLSPHKKFYFPLGNITETRFKGEALDGETVEGFRIGRD